MGRRWLIGVSLLVAPLLAPGTTDGAKPAKQSDTFFASREVVRIAIDVGNKDAESLRTDPRTHVRCTLTENGKVVYKGVGVHIKGAAGSTRAFDDKPGLTLNMGKFGVEQTFHGMEKWHLANSVQDPTYLGEMICGEMYRAEGLPAARVAHALVTINGKKSGLYYIKEGYDKYFRKRHFDSPHGNLYDGGLAREIDQPLQLLGGSKGDVEKHTDLKALWAAANVKKPEERFKRLAKVLDVDRFVTYLCLQVLTWDWDGYPMIRNNYRVYHDPKRDKIIFFPSGMDQMFAEPRGPLLPRFQGKIAAAFIETPEGRERYLKRMGEILKKFDAGAVARRVEELQKRLRPALESVDEAAARGYPAAVKRFGDAVVTRARFLEAELARAK